MTESEIKRLMKLRKTMRSKKPSFKRIESWRYKRVHGGWRAAKGIDSATRQKKHNGIKSPNVGYRSPKKVRGLHPCGLYEVLVSNIKDLDGISRKRQGITIDSKLGIRKRQKIIEEAQSRRIRILNLGISYDEKLKMKEMGLFSTELAETKETETPEIEEEKKSKGKDERTKDSIKLEEETLEKPDKEKVDEKKTAKKSTKDLEQIIEIFEKETGKNAIWRGKQTKLFTDWYTNYKKEESSKKTSKASKETSK